MSSYHAKFTQLLQGVGEKEGSRVDAVCEGCAARTGGDERADEAASRV